MLGNGDKMRFSYSRGQTLNEYALVLALVFAGLLTMQTFIKRGIQGAIKLTADDLGEPAKQVYNLNPQKIGAMELGLVSYNPAKPLKIHNERDITVTEYPRETTINKDKTEASGKWTTAYKLETGGTFSASEKTGKKTETKKPE